MLLSPHLNQLHPLHTYAGFSASLSKEYRQTNLSITGFDSAHTYSPHPTAPQYVRTLQCTRKLRLANPDTSTTSADLPIEVLIGGDHYWKVIQDNSPIRFSLTSPTSVHLYVDY